jgi:hypothetical protein
VVGAKLEGTISLGILFAVATSADWRINHRSPHPRDQPSASRPNQPGEIDATGDPGRNVWRVRLLGGFDFVCPGLRLCGPNFGWSS